MKIIRSAGIAAFLLMISEGVAFAVSEGGHHHAFNWSDFLFHWPNKEDGRIGFVYLLINFIVLIFLLQRLIIRKLANDQKARHETIKQQLEQATLARKQAEDALQKWNQQIDSIAAEREKILQDTRAQAELERERILQEAQQEADKLRVNAIAAIERELFAQRRRLEREIVELAVQQAEALIKKQFSPGDQEKLVHNYIQTVASTPDLLEGRVG